MKKPGGESEILTLDPAKMEYRPQQKARFAFQRWANQRAQPLARISTDFRLDRSKPRLLLRAIFHFRGIEPSKFRNRRLVFSCVCKIRRPFVAEPAAARAISSAIGGTPVHPRAIIAGNVVVNIPDHMKQDVDSDDIRQPKRRGLRPAERFAPCRRPLLERHPKLPQSSDRFSIEKCQCG